MRLFFHGPVGDRLEFIELRAMASEEPLHVPVPAPELAQAGEAVENVPRPFPVSFLHGRQGTVKRPCIRGVFHADALEVFGKGIALVMAPEDLVTLSLAVGEGIHENEPGMGHRLRKPPIDILGGVVRVYIDNGTLGVCRCLLEEGAHEAVHEGPGLSGPHNVVPGLKSPEKPIQFRNARTTVAILPGPYSSRPVSISSPAGCTLRYTFSGGQSSEPTLRRSSSIEMPKSRSFSLR